MRFDGGEGQANEEYGGNTQAEITDFYSTNNQAYGHDRHERENLVVNKEV